MNPQRFFCPACPQPVDKTQQFCPKCGTSLKWDEDIEGASKKPGFPKKVTLLWNIGALVLILCIGLGIYLHARNPDKSILHPLGQQQTILDLSWMPADYIQYSDSLAYNVPVHQTCSPLFVYCFEYEFISHNSCPNGFYAALNWKDKAGSVLDYTNASLPSLKADQIAKLTFNFSLPASTSFGGLEVSKLNCY